MAASMSSKLEPAIWSRDTGNITWRGGRTYSCTVTKTKFSRTKGLTYFLTHGAPRSPARAKLVS